MMLIATPFGTKNRDVERRNWQFVQVKRLFVVGVNSHSAKSIRKTWHNCVYKQQSI